MDPVLQRFGDVTIQRVEKPKPPTVPSQAAEAPHKSKDKSEDEDEEYYSSPDENNIEESAETTSSSNKRPFDFPFSSELELLPKKPKKNPVISKELTIDKVISKEFGDDALSSFSEDDLPTDFETDEFNSDEEPYTKTPIKEENPETSFADKLGGETFPDSNSKPIERSNETTDDYDYDIKEKLKEMGEISFETVKKGEKSKKPEVSTENEVVVTPAKKPDADDLERKSLAAVNMRRNIREVMDETKLDEATLAAQREEMERLQRVQEQQKLLRELQRQAAQDKMQNKVISLLQGNFSKPGPSTARIGNTVLVKLPNGQTKPMARLPKRPLDIVRVQKSTPSPMAAPQLPRGGLMGVKKPISNLTPSVSIAPVLGNKKPPPYRPVRSDSESEGEELPPPVMQRRISKDEAHPSSAPIEVSSDDDCIVVSEPEGEPEEEDEDPSNSGMHTNDEFNQPDAEGRVLINVGHPDTDPDIFLAPQIARIIKPHQIGGVRFLYDNVIESTGRFSNSSGFGCILAHSMGLGKTLQIVCFSDIFLRHTPAKTILCIMPINTLQNWMAEYNMWLPTEENAPTSEMLSQGEVRPRTFNLHVLNDSHKTLTARWKVIQAWRGHGGVLLIGYEQFRLLSLKKHPKSRRKGSVVEPPDDNKNKAMFDAVHEALIDPGPDLVICDEGHRIKNSHASISQALKQMKTKRRIVLTGYPLQNNLMEYWCMVDFARPNYLGTKTEFCNMFERPIMNGQCIDSTESDIKLMRYRAHVLHSLLAGFVQRRSHRVLQTALPQKEEYVLLVRMTNFQRDLYETFMNDVVRIQSVPNPLKAFAVCCKIWNHPDVLYNFLKKRADGCARDIDLEEVAGVAATKETATKKQPTPKGGRKSSARGRPPNKPAASVTPNNTETKNSQPNTTNTFFEHSDSAQFPSSFDGQSTDTAHAAGECSNDSKSYLDISGKEHFPRNFNFWNQCNEGIKDINTSFSDSGFGRNSESPSWLKNEQTESKPKINIISDIKLPSMFGSALNINGNSSSSSDMKIKILSDIKLEAKKEERDDDLKDFSLPIGPTAQPVPPIKDEVKEEEKPQLTPDTLVKNNLMNLRDKEDCGIPYDWAVDLLKDYIPGRIENSAKMEILFCIIRESISLGDRLLVFSQSLITLDLIEQFLQSSLVPGDQVNWCRNVSYFRLDGSTSALEREKLINEFNSNPKIHLFLVSTRAGSLGINLIGANRVVVLDASWNPCHDTQAVCRVYRYGQRKPCYVYRLVVDNCLEKRIYDRQINKQGMSDRVVDECNPDAHLTLKDVSTLCWDNKYDEGEEKDWSHVRNNYMDGVMQKVLELYGRRLNREPFQHESLLVDRKEKQLSQLEKRLAKKSYEREKLASRQPLVGPVRGHRPIASVRPMQQGGPRAPFNQRLAPGNDRPTRWIPAEHWQRQGMTAQEMTLPLDVVIPTNQPERGNIVLKAGQKVLVLKSPKGVYMQLESGKIVAIKTAIKMRGKSDDSNDLATKKPSIFPPTDQAQHHQQRKANKPFGPGMGPSVGAVKTPVRGARQTAASNIINMQRTPSQAGKSRSFTTADISKLVNERPSTISSNEERREQRSKMGDIERQISMLNNQISIKRTPAVTQKPPHKKLSQTDLEKLERTTSLTLTDNLPYQDSLDSIASGGFKDDNHLDDEIESTVSSSDLNKHITSEGSDQSDEVTYVSEQPPEFAQDQLQTHLNIEPKLEPQQDYAYNYYNYQQYGAPVPAPLPPPAAQPYSYSQPQPYDMMSGYPAQQQPPQQPQYNYGYQNYPPPTGQAFHNPPQPGYDFNPPPQPMYPPYNPYPQQYAPPPPQPIYTPPQVQGNIPQYQDYQYQQPVPVQNTPPNPPQTFYPNS